MASIASVEKLEPKQHERRKTPSSRASTLDKPLHSQTESSRRKRSKDTAGPSRRKRRSESFHEFLHHGNGSHGDDGGTGDVSDYLALSEAANPPPIPKSPPPDTSSTARRDSPGFGSGPRSAQSGNQILPLKKKFLLNGDPPWLSKIYIASHLIVFAILGTLLRLGIQWIVWFPGVPIITPVLWANFAGSLIMGFLAEDQGLFRPSTAALPGGEENGTHSKRLSKGKKKIDRIADGTSKDALVRRKKRIPLYIGLSTGFCGSLTSFSSFARDMFLALSYDLPSPIGHPGSNATPATAASTTSRSGGYSFQAWIHVILSTVALSIGGLTAGAHIAILLDPLTPRIHHPRIAQRIIDPLMVILAVGLCIPAIVLSVWPPDRRDIPDAQTWRGEILFALVFAPVGCLARFYASFKLNPLVSSFPLGTFASNMLGTAVLAACWDVQHVGVGTVNSIGGGVVGCQVLQGVMDGFCGCLTTISTWALEVKSLKIKHGWIYASVSVAGATALTIVIMGSVRWSIGWQTPVCATGYTSRLGAIG